jgi:ubiquinone/menaquinone biosynthesis C-methylase UbiE
VSKIFSEWYDFFMNPLERGRFHQIRRHLLEKATGDVLEIGSGTGVNFPLYQVGKITAIEPSEYMITRSQRRKEEAIVPIEVIQASAEQLPFADNTFDTVVATLVYCTIPNVDRAVEEMKRVCKPEGRILMFEHVKMKQPYLARLQEMLTPFWRKICDGCCLNRDTYKIMEQHGFTVLDKNEFYKSLFITMTLKNEK